MSTSRLGLSFWAIVLLVTPACNSIDLPQETPDAPLEKWTGDPSLGDPSLMDAYNDPADLEPDFVRRFDDLPLSGTADQIPWTDSYWPKNKGGISYRWQTEQAHT